MKKLYYKSKQQFYGPTQKLFEIGDICDKMFLVMSGVIDIIVHNEHVRQVIDTVGKGSVLGMNFILKKE